MQVDVVIAGAERIGALQSHIRRQLLSRVAEHAGRLRRVAVCLYDQCGRARGIALTTCRIEADVEALPEAVVSEALAPNPYQAANEAIERLGAVLDGAVRHRERTREAAPAGRSTVAVPEA